MDAARSPTVLTLSVFDRSPPERVLAIAPALEQLGYRRYWLSEHRSAPATPNPTLLAGIAATVTKRLRVGTAGVMLRYNSPRKIAEDFRLLDRLFPGRVDLGTIAGREKSDAIHEELLDGRSDSSQTSNERLTRLLDLIAGTDGGSVGPTGTASAHVDDDSRIQPWVCSMHAPGATLAGERGAGFAYHLYLARQFGKTDGPELVSLYRDKFTPSSQIASPATALVVVGCCAAESGAAHALWRQVFQIAPDVDIEVGAFPSGPDFIGTPDECVAQLQAVERVYGPVEFVVHCVNDGLASQLRQLELLAQHCGLQHHARVGPGR